MQLQLIKSFTRLFINLIKKDLLIYFKTFYLGDLLDNIIWTGSFIFIMTHIMPQIGLSEAYGAFFAVSMIVSVAFWDSWNTATQFIADLDGNRTIEYYLTLPLPATLYFIEQICFIAIRSSALSLGIIPLSKIILWNQLSLTPLASLKTITIFICSMFFCSTMSLFFASLVKNINNIGHVGIRILFPMFSLGCTQYSWFTIYAFSPAFAYFSLVNPLLYSVEGIHAAMLGQSGFLSLCLCIIVTTLSTIIIAWLSIKTMKKRLDCI